MDPQTQAWLLLVAQGAEALVWLVLTAWSLQRMRTHAWARCAALGAVAMFVPATTLLAARAQVLLAESTTILGNYTTSSLPAVYGVLRVLAAGLLLAAVVVAGRRPLAGAAATP